MPERSLVMLMEKSKLHFDKFTAFAVAILVPAFSFWTMLFWRMSSLYLGPRGYYHADFSDHINFFLFSLAIEASGDIKSRQNPTIDSINKE